MGGGEKQVDVREAVLPGWWLTEEGDTQRVTATAPSCVWPALSVQEFAKNYLLENSAPTAIAFIIRAPLAAQEPWSSSEPHPCLGGGIWGQNTRLATSVAPEEGQPLSETQPGCPPPSWLGPPAGSLMRLFLLPPSHPSSGSATDVYMLPLNPVAVPGWPEGMWVRVVGEEYGSEGELWLSVVLSAAWWAWGKWLINFAASVASSVKWEWSLPRAEEQMRSNSECPV